MEGKALHNVQNAMFAAVMAYAMGVKVENVRQGLRTFDTSYFQVPGRMNVFDKLPFKVILDYGHNPAAVQAMADLARRLDCSGRRICVLSAPGDRRDEDIEEIARIAGKAFDHIVVRRDDDLRGRGSDEVPKILETALLASGYPKEQIEVLPDEHAAIDAALRFCKRGDLLVAFADMISRSWKQVIYFKADSREKSSPPSAPGAEGSASGPVFDTLARHATTPAELLEGAHVIQDERGVRLAREQDD